MVHSRPDAKWTLQPLVRVEPEAATLGAVEAKADVVVVGSEAEWAGHCGALVEPEADRGSTKFRRWTRGAVDRPGWC